MLNLQKSLNRRKPSAPTPLHSSVSTGSNSNGNSKEELVPSSAEEEQLIPLTGLIVKNKTDHQDTPLLSPIPSPTTLLPNQKLVPLPKRTLKRSHAVLSTSGFTDASTNIVSEPTNSTVSSLNTSPSSRISNTSTTITSQSVTVEPSLLHLLPRVLPQTPPPDSTRILRSSRPTRKSGKNSHQPSPSSPLRDQSCETQLTCPPITAPPPNPKLLTSSQNVLDAFSTETSIAPSVNNQNHQSLPLLPLVPPVVPVISSQTTDQYVPYVYPPKPVSKAAPKRKYTKKTSLKKL